MSQKTFTVQHPGDYAPSRQAFIGALDASLREDDLERVGEAKVLSSHSRGGFDTKYTVDVKTKKLKAEAD